LCFKQRVFFNVIRPLFTDEPGCVQITVQQHALHLNNEGLTSFDCSVGDQLSCIINFENV
jgi:hypothetical protein